MSRVGQCGNSSVRSVPSNPHESLNRPDNHDPPPSDPGSLRSLNLLVDVDSGERSCTSLRSSWSHREVISLRMPVLRTSPLVSTPYTLIYAAERPVHWYTGGVLLRRARGHD